MNKDIVSNLVDKFLPEILKIRRDIHKHPEFGFEERRTSQLVAKRLERLGLEVKRGVAGTGVVALLKGRGRGKTIAFRADLDALPITEQNQVDYASSTPGVMHACGHDGHTAMVLGVALVLNELKERFRGNVKFIFQPAEEAPKLVVDKCGKKTFIRAAQLVIEEGALKNPNVDMIIAPHLWPDIPSGKIGLVPGTILASADTLELVIKGKAGHGSAPHQGVDAILVACQVVNLLQSIVSREIDPLEPATITIGTIKGGYRRNVIADRVEMTGTIRALSPRVRKKIHREIKRIVDHVTEALGGSYELEIIPSGELVVNDPEVTNFVATCSREILGEENTFTNLRPSLGNEDFGLYLSAKPGTLILVGTHDEGQGFTYPLHHPNFDFGIEPLRAGTTIMAYTAWQYLTSRMAD